MGHNQSQTIGVTWAVYILRLDGNQCFLLTSYAAKYKGGSSLYGIAVPLYGSAVIVWVCLGLPNLLDSRKTYDRHFLYGACVLCSA